MTGRVVDFSYILTRVISSSTDHRRVDTRNPAIAYTSDMRAYDELYVASHQHPVQYVPSHTRGISHDIYIGTCIGLTSVFTSDLWHMKCLHNDTKQRSEAF